MLAVPAALQQVLGGLVSREGGAFSGGVFCGRSLRGGPCSTAYHVLALLVCSLFVSKQSNYERTGVSAEVHLISHRSRLHPISATFMAWHSLHLPNTQPAEAANDLATSQRADKSAVVLPFLLSHSASLAGCRQPKLNRIMSGALSAVVR